MRKQALFQPGDDHDRELQPLGAVQRHHQHVAVLGPGLFVGVRQQRQLIDEPRQRRLRRAALVFARRGDQLHQVLDPPLGLLAVLLPQILQVARSIEHLAERNGHRGFAVVNCRSLDQARERRPAPCPPGCDQPLFQRPRSACARATVALTTGWRPAKSGGASSSGAGVDRLERVHHALADAPRRHVDHAPQADVVVRVERQAQVGQRVLDFLALVEPDAADDAIGDAGAPEARPRWSATARWCDTAPRRESRRRPAAPGGRCGR